jgi:hypothetical protein
MQNRLSTRSLAVLAVCLAVATSVFCWRWASRQVAAVQKHERNVMLMESRQDELETQLLGIAALLLKASENGPELERIQPSSPLIAGLCGDLETSPVLRSIEQARADLFLIWYYQNIRKYYLMQY